MAGMMDRNDSWRLPRRDRLVLTMLMQEAVNAARSLAIRDLAWIVFGGGILTAYGTGLLCGALRTYASVLQARPGVTIAILCGIALLSGAMIGQTVTRLARRRAWAPFTLALPLDRRDRRRMAAAAALTLGTALLAVEAGGVAAALSLVDPWFARVGAALVVPVFATGFAMPFGLGLRAGEIRPIAAAVPSGAASRRSLSAFERLLRCRPAWLDAWAWRLAGGRVRFDRWLVAKGFGLGVVAILAIVAGLRRHDAVPASLVGTFGGLAIVMISLRCRPLASPVLRTGPMGFTRLALRLMLMPVLLSGAYFVVLAGGAVAAEPAGWPMPAQGAVELAVLSGIYAVFALYFVARPGVAALAFLAAVGDAAYESLEYGRPVYLALALLVVFLWVRARRRFSHG